jgi:hypothetical protein
MTTAAAPVDIAAITARLKEKEATLGDGRDARSYSERAAYCAEYNATQQAITSLANLPSDIARQQARLDES